MSGIQQAAAMAVIYKASAATTPAEHQHSQCYSSAACAEQKASAAAHQIAACTCSRDISAVVKILSEHDPQ